MPPLHLLRVSLEDAAEGVLIAQLKWPVECVAEGMLISHLSLLRLPLKYVAKSMLIPHHLCLLPEYAAESVLIPHPHVLRVLLESSVVSELYLEYIQFYR